MKYVFQELFRGKSPQHGCEQCSNWGGVFSPVFAVSLLMSKQVSCLCLPSSCYLLHSFNNLFTYRHSFSHLFKPAFITDLKRKEDEGNDIFKPLSCCSTCIWLSFLFFFLHTQRASQSMEILNPASKSITNAKATVPPALFYTLLYRHQRWNMWLGLWSAVNSLKVNQQSVFLTHIPQLSIQKCMYHVKAPSISVP